MDAYRTAYVYVRNVFAGILKETDYGYLFTYDSGYISKPDSTPVSLTLPIQEKEYKSKTLFAFFDGLIPEGWLLNIVIHNWKLNPKDRFGLLLASCKDPVGNVCIKGERE